MSDSSDSSSEERVMEMTLTTPSLDILRSDFEDFKNEIETTGFTAVPSNDTSLLALDYCLAHDWLDKAEYLLMKYNYSEEQLSALLNYNVYSIESMDLLLAYGALTSNDGVDRAVKEFNTDQLRWYLTNGGQIDYFTAKKWRKIILNAPTEFVRYLMKVNDSTIGVDMDDVSFFKESFGPIYKNTKVIQKAKKRQRDDID